MERTDDDLLDLDDLAKHLKVKRRSIHRMIAKGRLPPPVRYGGLPRWRWGLLRDWHRAFEALERMKKEGQDVTGATLDATSEPRDPIAAGKADKRK